MEQLRSKIPSPGTLIAWLGVLGTIFGLVTFVLLDLPEIFGKEGGDDLTQEEIIATIGALQNDKGNAELQLTEIALAQQQAANQETQQAIDRQQANVQATFDAIGTQQAVFVATQNAIAAASATAQAEVLAVTATQDAINVAATQTAENATATANFLAQITPTPTPEPTATPTPVPSSDHRLLVDSSIEMVDGLLEFALETARPIPNKPNDGLTYVWLLDIDRDIKTGLEFRELGIDVRVAVSYTDKTWVGRIRRVLPDGSLGEPQFFTEFSISGQKLFATIKPGEFGLPSSFDWFTRVEINDTIYSSFPEEEFLTFTP